MAFNQQRARIVAILKKQGPDWLDQFEQTFITAIGEASEKRPKMLAAILRSDGFLTLLRSEFAERFLDWLARYVEGSFNRPRHRPASLGPTPVRRVANGARQIKQEKRCPTKVAIKEACEEAKAKGMDVTFEQVQTELRRSTQPAKRKAARTRSVIAAR
jgi:hypothetical protein